MISLKVVRFLSTVGLLIMALNWAIGQSGDRVIALFEAGEQQLNSGQYKEAIQSFAKVVALKGNYADAYYYRGMQKRKCNDPEGALMDYSIALEWNTDFAEALLARARVYYEWNGMMRHKMILKNC